MGVNVIVLWLFSVFSASNEEPEMCQRGRISPLLRAQTCTMMDGWMSAHISFIGVFSSVFSGQWLKLTGKIQNHRQRPQPLRCSWSFTSVCLTLKQALQQTSAFKHKTKMTVFTSLNVSPQLFLRYNLCSQKTKEL